MSVAHELSKNHARCAIAVMAKAPRPGLVKTRLVPPLSADEAMTLSGCFLQDVTANVALAAQRAPIDGFVAYAPDGAASLLAPIIAPGTRLVLADGSTAMPPGIDGIGRSLLHAAQALLAQGYGAICLLNADSPTLPTDRLSDAALALLAPGDRAVLGAAEDGGYYLLGLKAAHPALFRDVAWSTDRVADQTRHGAGQCGLSVTELPLWYDIDDAASLRRLLSEVESATFAAPTTRAWLAAHDLHRRLGLPAAHRPARARA
jgi:rSAM/selenodomain-associated transferase 1